MARYLCTVRKGRCGPEWLPITPNRVDCRFPTSLSICLIPAKPPGAGSATAGLSPGYLKLNSVASRIAYNRKVERVPAGSQVGCLE